MIFFLVFSILYAGFLHWCRYHWQHIWLHMHEVKTYHSFTVLLPVRNEAANIQHLISDLQQQQYPKDRFEVIVINDASEDETLALAKAALAACDLSFQVIHLPDLALSGKKNALTAGVNAAKGEIILATDGDCRLPAGWIAAYNRTYQQPELRMVTGPVRMQSTNFFTSLQAAEFSGLIGIGAASLQSGNPGMCNGANLSYYKEAFLAVKGYEGNLQIASGDDEFLLQKIYKLHPHGVQFLKDPEAIVNTPAKATFGELINQRVRWSSKWKFHKSIYIRLLAILVFLGYLSLVLGFVQSITSASAASLFAALMLFRWLSLWYFAQPILSFFGIRKGWFRSLCVEIIYPIIVLFLGLASIFGHYSWKGRQYK